MMMICFIITDEDAEVNIRNYHLSPAHDCQLNLSTNSLHSISTSSWIFLKWVSYT
jgi:hypothetical protein